MKKNFMCDFIGCNRVFNQSNHLNQHKQKFHISNASKYRVSKIIDEEQDVDWEFDGESVEEILNNFTLPPIILQNPNLETSIVVIDININNPDFFINDKPISIYSNFQEQCLSRLNYNKNILNIEINSLEEFHNAIINPTIFDTILVKHVGYIKLYDLNLSESGGQKLLDNMNFFLPTRPLPSQWRTVTNFMKEQIDSFPIYSIVVDYPVEWLLEKSKYEPLRKITIDYIDPMELVASFLIDPRLMIIHKSEIKFKYSNIKDNKNNTCFGDLFTSEFAKDNEEYINQTHPQNPGLLLPIILYWDGVNVADIGNVNVDTVMISLGNFSDKLMTNDVTKKVICYLPTLSSIESSTLLQHLQDIGITKTEAKKQMMLFKRLIFSTFWNHVLNSINMCWNRGVELHIIGKGTR